MDQSINELMQQESDVPCGTCSACCVNDFVYLNPEVDSLPKYQWHFEFGIPVLDRKENGECIYLDNGCSIHADRPLACRRFDCRVWFLVTSKRKRKDKIKVNPSLKRVFIMGEKLLPTLDRTKKP